MDKYDKDGNKIYEITISVDKFKEILIHSWNLLSPEMRAELTEMGVHPKYYVIYD